MGTFINKGNEAFRDARSGEYVDKSALISVINSTLCKESRYTCVTRCRRFGKSMAAEMLRAYYDESCDSLELFQDLRIAGDASFLTHLNKYPVIYLDITSFTTKYPHDSAIVQHIQDELKIDILSTYPDVRPAQTDDLMNILMKVHASTGKQFIMIIDEWDAICREFRPDTKGMDEYVQLLRRLFKSSDSKDVFAGVYMTGILPIKKYKTESALNNFWEYSMIQPRRLSDSFGFTSGEVKALCEKFGRDYSELAAWYDGYKIGKEESIFNPNSVMSALFDGECNNYWSKTGAFEAVSEYIGMNYDGLKDDIINMLSGARCPVNTTAFTNDPSQVKSKDDVLTILIHLGYLSYDRAEEECYIPNKEVSKEMENAVKTNNWKQVSDALSKSKSLLKATLRGDADAVAAGIDAAHDENTSILSYNDENSLSCVLSIAYYYARNDYIMHREMATGKGYADIVLVPRRNVDSPALVIELKYDRAVQTAVDQIRSKNYPDKVAEYVGDILLVGITYDRRTKSHTCRIETYTKWN